MKKAEFFEKAFSTVGWLITAATLMFFAVSYLRFDPPVITGMFTMAGMGIAYCFITIGSLLRICIEKNTARRRKQLRIIRKARKRAMIRMKVM